VIYSRLTLKNGKKGRRFYDYLNNNYKKKKEEEEGSYL